MALHSVRPDSESTAARLLHPEDISVGDHVCVASVLFQFPSFFWCGHDSFANPREHLVQIAFLPVDEFYPLKVNSVCLPFVLVQDEKDKARIIDVRRFQLFRIDAGFARRVKQGLASKKKGKRKKRF